MIRKAARLLPLTQEADSHATLCHTKARDGPEAYDGLRYGRGPDLAWVL